MSDHSGERSAGRSSTDPDRTTGHKVDIVLVTGNDGYAEAVLDLVPTDRFNVARSRSVSQALGQPNRFVGEIVVVADHSADPIRSPAVAAALSRFPERVVLVVATDADDELAAAKAVAAGAADCLAIGHLTTKRLGRALSLAAARLEAGQSRHHLAADLIRVNRELSDFAHILTHDLRAPVRRSRLLADRLLATLSAAGTGGAGGAGSGGSTELGDLLGGELADLEHLLVSLLDYVTTTSELPPARPVDLSQAVERSVDEATSRLGLEPGAVAVERPERPVGALAGEAQVERVVGELLTNAATHTPTGPPNAAAPLAVTVSVSSLRDRARVDVADNGPGIPASTTDLVFRPLERLKVDGPGCGLGLSICRRVVDAYGGAIWIAEPDGTGTNVVVELPAADLDLLVDR
jgi:signal transduction histidine kinase